MIFVDPFDDDEEDEEFSDSDEGVHECAREGIFFKNTNRGDRQVKFKLKRKHEEVTLEGVDGLERLYILHELNGLEREQYLSKVQSKAIIKGGETQGLKDCLGLETGLVALSLKLDGKPVPQSEIETWPAEVVAALSEKVKELSNLEGDSAPGNV